ncbi:MAG: Lrp/AsnC family transcriptional regulator [Nanoarchaeota archaeon]
MSLDLKDKKILYYLDRNARQSNAEIARSAGISKQVVGFRIKKFIDDAIISFFYTIVDVSKFGFTLHKNFVRFHNLTRKKEEEFIQFLKENKDIVWAASCDGMYDFVFSIWSKDLNYLNNVLKEINNKFGDFIYERQVATILRGDYFPRDYLLNKKRDSISEVAFYGSTGEKENLDEIDKKVLLELGKNARINAVDISTIIKISADAVADRIRKLERLKIIKNYIIVPNEMNYPYLHYKVLLSLRNSSDEFERRLVQYCKSNSNIIYIVKALGQWDYEIDVEVENVEKFRELMMSIKTEFQDNLKDYSPLNIYKVHKYNFFPSIFNEKDMKK